MVPVLVVIERMMEEYFSVRTVSTSPFYVGLW
jgi:hypothetical protein